MAEKTEPMRLSDAEALIENVVRKQVPEVGEVWFWGSPTGSRSARGADGRSLHAYWQTDVQRHERGRPRVGREVGNGIRSGRPRRGCAKRRRRGL